MSDNDEDQSAPVVVDENPFIDFEKENLSVNNNFFNNNSIINDNMDNMDVLINKAKNLSINIISEKKKLIPRDYQMKIYEKAKYQNSIIYVETGKGKTFISIMLMADLLGIDILNNENKKIVFFVCNTALINQQKKEIESILNIDVGTIQGKKDKESKSDYDAFKSKWNSYNIFIAIPSIFYKILSCGFIKIFDISMLVFDECHHTADDHPYNKIMNEFYFFYKKKFYKLDNYNYPRIYGLTASPMKTGVNGNALEITAFDALQKLSENLDCVIVIDPEMDNSNVKEMRPWENLSDDIYIEIKYHINIKEYNTIFIELYKNCFVKMITICFSDLDNKNEDFATEDYVDKYPVYLKKKFKAINLEVYNKICQNYKHLYDLQKYSPFFVIFEKLQRHIFMILENLCLDSLIYYFDTLVNNYNILYQQKLEENKINNSLNVLNSIECDEDEDDETDVLSLDPESIMELKQIYFETSKKLKIIKNGNNYISDRLNKLYEYINMLFIENNNSKIIVFIANRIVAHFLNPALSSYLKENHENKKCHEIIGINKRKSGGGTTLTPSLTLKKLNDIISEFNNDKFNILIGTSAIEEGLDIQSCNAVLALVELNTPKSYIQIKGRARKANSYFYIFTNSTKDAKMKIDNFKTIGKKIKDLFEGDIIKDFRREGYIYKKPNFVFEMDTISHSKITMGNVTIFFNELKQQIEASGINFKTQLVIKNNKDSQEFIGYISLETDLKDIQKEFPYETKKLKNKENATKECHFYVLLKLKQYKYLDCHLKFCKNKF